MSLKSMITELHKKIIHDPTIAEMERQLKDAEDMVKYHYKKMTENELNAIHFKKTIERLKEFFK